MNTSFHPSGIDDDKGFVDIYRISLWIDDVAHKNTLRAEQRTLIQREALALASFWLH